MPHTLPLLLLLLVVLFLLLLLHFFLGSYPLLPFFQEHLHCPRQHFVSLERGEERSLHKTIIMTDAGKKEI